jgi:hypothetical protein
VGPERGRRDLDGLRVTPLPKADGVVAVRDQPAGVTPR